jgi:hypothetical protein
MPHALVALLFFLAQPFWESKVPEQWTDQEIDILCHASPWAQTTNRDPEVLVYLATAAPIEEAEGELRLRSKRPLAEPDPDYNDFLRLNREKVLVLAIPWTQARFGTDAEQKQMEEESLMIVGRKKYQLVGHFPPSRNDPVLRLVFPREVKEADKAVLFQLYLPGMPFPERDVEFRTKDLLYHGKLEM